MTRVSIGTSPCPLKECNEAAIPVYEYKSAGDPKRARFAGRVFGICNACGRVEQSGYLLKHLTRADASSHASNASSSAPANASSSAPANASARVPTRNRSNSGASRSSRSSGSPPLQRRANPHVTPSTSNNASAGDSWLPDFWGKK